jgi:hypothetical protein
MEKPEYTSGIGVINNTAVADDMYARLRWEGVIEKKQCCDREGGMAVSSMIIVIMVKKW